MGPVAITLDSPTARSGLARMGAGVVGALGEAASQFSTSAGLPDSSIVIRITDDFVPEVQASSRDELPPFTTERYGGGVAGITLPPHGDCTKRFVLLNATVLATDHTWTFVHLPAVLAHEVAHCLIELCRQQAGDPRGYSKRPTDLLEAVRHSAVSVFDEYLADELAKSLLSPFDVTYSTDEGEAHTSDRVMLGVDALAQMRDSLDEHVYPALRDRVLQYCEAGDDLDGMVNHLSSAIPASLILSAHYRAAVRELPPTDESTLVADHPATRLYLKPFWDRVGPVLDDRLNGPLWSRFAQGDQQALDVAAEAMLAFWAALGISLEPQGEGRVYVNVDEPDDRR